MTTTKRSKPIRVKDSDLLKVRNFSDADNNCCASWQIFSKKGKIRVDLEFTKAQLYIMKHAIEQSLLEFAIHDAGEDGFVITDDLMDRTERR